MNEYIATFHSHFGALSYCKALKEQAIIAKPMPTPRKLSSSCGTCVYYAHSSAIDADNCELDSVFLKTNDTFACVIKK